MRGDESPRRTRAGTGDVVPAAVGAAEGGRPGRSVGGIDPEDSAEARPVGRAFQVDELLLGHSIGVLGTEQGIAAAVPEPADRRLFLEPHDDHLAVELTGVFLMLGIRDRGTVGNDRRHRVAADLDAAVLLLGLEPLPASRWGEREFEVDRLEIALSLLVRRALRAVALEELEGGPEE